MFKYLAKKVFGSSNDRIINSIKNIVIQINNKEAEIMRLTDQQLKAKTQEFRQQIAKGATLDSLLVDAFAVTREAAKRTLGQRHFDTQLIGGIVLHRGMIMQMATGEGKTLSSVLPAYLNALTNKGVHVVTVNDYLAQRDSHWMGQIYNFLGLSVACITAEISDSGKKAAYEADILYGTNNEFGFDYLRDNLKHSADDMVQKPFHYAIIDEVDSILIDESRTPLIISGPTDDSTDLYYNVNKIIPQLLKDSFTIDEKAKNISLTDQGHSAVEDLLKQNSLINLDTSLYDIENMSLIHHINQALRAHKIFTKETDYIVKDGQVLIIDEFTGRIMEGRRYSDGLHQALEAKENVKIQNENQTLASITFQNYFRMYPKLSGMTGTAMTEAQEFMDIYKLEIVQIPTHLPSRRIDYDDVILCTAKEKYKKIVDKIRTLHDKGQPILIGTISIEKSEYLSSLLKKQKIKHKVLNAKYHAQEAEIIAQAGRLNAVTIATNMAGRGTDIQLGGNKEILLKIMQQSNKKISATEIEQQVEQEYKKILDLGGLFILCTERHESRRIDNQLRGRAGRQGDKGETIFYLSLEDDLMRLFGSEKIGGLLTKIGLKEGEEIIHPWISRSLRKAQQKVEARNYDIRKNLLQFDNVANEQRKIIYKQRFEIIQKNEQLDTVYNLMQDINELLIDQIFKKNNFAEQEHIAKLQTEMQQIYGSFISINDLQEGIEQQDIFDNINKQVQGHLAIKISTYSPELFNNAIKHIMLITLDYLWKDHLYSLDHLRKGINLRAFAQKDPLNEYKIEAFALFKNMLTEYKKLVAKRISQLEITHEAIPQNEEVNSFETRNDNINDLKNYNNMVIRKIVLPEDRDPNNLDTWGKVSRNEVCPCGSGKKYKQCHGIM